MSKKQTTVVIRSARPTLIVRGGVSGVRKLNCAWPERGQMAPTYWEIHLEDGYVSTMMVRGIRLDRGSDPRHLTERRYVQGDHANRPPRWLDLLAAKAEWYLRRKSKLSLLPARALRKLIRENGYHRDNPRLKGFTTKDFSEDRMRSAILAREYPDIHAVMGR